MKTLMTVLGAMVFAASATAGDIYGGFGGDPDLSLWRGAPAHAMGVQPGIGDASSMHRGGGADSNLFKSAPSARSVDTMNASRVDIYGGFGGPGSGLQRGL
jgi:hypothetical protein